MALRLEIFEVSFSTCESVFLQEDFDFRLDVAGCLEGKDFIEEREGTDRDNEVRERSGDRWRTSEEARDFVIVREGLLELVIPESLRDELLILLGLARENVLEVRAVE